MKRIAQIATLCVTAIALTTTASAQEQSDPQGQALLKKVSDSFSALPFESDLMAVRSQLKGPVSANCAQDESCSFPDTKGTQHVFWGDDENAPLLLVVKRALAADFKNKAIPALNIGTARSRADVLKNVRAFLPETKVTCLEAKQAGEGDGIASCGASMGDGWIKILFNSDNQLIEARVDAYQFT